VRDAVASSSSHQGTGSFDHATAGFDAEREDSSMMYRVGQAAMVLSGAALVALAAKRGRSWQTIGAAALAGAPVIYRGATGHWPVPQSVAQSVAQKAADAVATAPIETAVTISKPRAELYDFWRRLENLPRFMKNLDAVTDLGGGRSHWVGKSPLGFKVEWDAEIVEERPGELLSWRSLPGAGVTNSGTVTFTRAPQDRGTEVRVELTYSLPAGRLGSFVAKLFGEEPRQQVSDDLRRFKQVVETGEVVVSDGNPIGTRTSRQFKQRPGQPVGAGEVR
jgi:uncharacterized membrane protein